MDDCTTILEVERAAATSAAPASTSQASRDDAKSPGEEDGDDGDGEKWKGIGRVFPESCVIEDIDAGHLVLIRDQFKNRDARVSILLPPKKRRMVKE